MLLCAGQQHDQSWPVHLHFKVPNHWSIGPVGWGGVGGLAVWSVGRSRWADIKAGKLLYQCMLLLGRIGRCHLFFYNCKLITYSRLHKFRLTVTVRIGLGLLLRKYNS